MDGAVFELGTDGPVRILVGVDGSETSMRAGAYAAGLARRQGAQLIVVFVKKPPLSALPETNVAMMQIQDETAQQLRTLVEQQAPRLGQSVVYLVRTGNPYKELLKVAAERRVDAIVVGASTQSGHRFVGSLAGRLVRKAAWPVTVVP